MNLRALVAGRSTVLVKHHPRVTTALRAFTSAKRLQENSSGMDVHTEATHRGIDALQDRFDEMEEQIKKIVKALKIE